MRNATRKRNRAERERERRGGGVFSWLYRSTVGRFVEFGQGVWAAKVSILSLSLTGLSLAAGMGAIGYLMSLGPSEAPDGSPILFAAKRPALPGTVAGRALARENRSLEMFSQANTERTPAPAIPASAHVDPVAAPARGEILREEKSGPVAVEPSKNGIMSGLLGRLFNAFGSDKKSGYEDASFHRALGSSGVDIQARAAVAARGQGEAGGMSRSAIGPGAARTLSGRSRSGDSLGQAFSASGDSRRAVATGYGAGRTFEGSVVREAQAVDSPGTVDLSKAGSTPDAATAESTLNQKIDQDIPAPATPGTSDAGSPWQKDVDRAQILLGIGMALLGTAYLLAKVPSPWAATARKVIAVVVMAIGLALIASGYGLIRKYHQKRQGNVIILEGIALITAAAMVMAADQDSGSEDKADSTKDEKKGETDAQQREREKKAQDEVDAKNQKEKEQRAQQDKDQRAQEKKAQDEVDAKNQREKDQRAQQDKDQRAQEQKAQQEKDAQNQRERDAQRQREKAAAEAKAAAEKAAAEAKAAAAKNAADPPKTT